MRTLLIVILISCNLSFANNFIQCNNTKSYIDLKTLLPENLKNNSNKISEIQIQSNYCKINPTPLSNVKKLLDLHSNTLHMPVINTVLTIIKCIKARGIYYNNILTIIDYSLPSNQKRLWVFDLKQKKLLFYTYVTHGINSGTLATDYFSNTVNSKASSLGVFITENAYYGRDGISLKLIGLERHFNDAAYRRNIVMHGAWYADSEFITKYGRVGRSWGCPALPQNLAKEIFETIKNQSLVVVYYPSSDWLLGSKFLSCSKQSIENMVKNIKILPTSPAADTRGDILYVDKNNNHQHEENDPVLVISADNYQYIFNQPPPLTRMLRRQIENTEFIVLNANELSILDTNYDNIISVADDYGLNAIELVIPIIINVRGYYQTKFQFVNLGTITAIKLDPLTGDDFIQIFDNKLYSIRENNDFIRWIGL